MSITSAGLSDHELGTALESSTSVAGYEPGTALEIEHERREAVGQEPQNH